MGTPRTMRSARWKREANSLIFSHVAVSTGVIGSPETPLYLALIASKSNSGRRSCQISNVSTKRFPARSLYSERNASTIAADTDFSFRGEATMFKTCIFELLQACQGRRPQQVTAADEALPFGLHQSRMPAGLARRRTSAASFRSDSLENRRCRPYPDP